MFIILDIQNVLVIEGTVLIKRTVIFGSESEFNMSRK